MVSISIEVLLGSIALNVTLSTPARRIEMEEKEILSEIGMKRVASGSFE
jgi:hypothetical protein